MGPPTTTATTTTTTRELNPEEEDLDSCRHLIEPPPDAAAMFIDQVHLYFYLLFVTVLCSCSACSRIAAANDPGTTTRIYDFRVDYANVTRLNYTKSMPVVNGQYPGPKLHVHEGDSLIVTVTNLIPHPVTIHWHGVRQLRTGWADGVPYITQCPIQQNQSYTHRFRVVNQTGTLWWHAHTSWQRASLHGAIIVYRRKHRMNDAPPWYPFPRAQRELTAILGEWWNADVEQVVTDALATGGAYRISDALTINGHPGYLYNFSSADACKVKATPGYTYLVHIVNSCMNFGLYFALANHSLVLVRTDSGYVQPFMVDVVIVQPGQSVDVLVTANHTSGKFYMAATPFSVAPYSTVPYPLTPATALFTYSGSSHVQTVNMPTFPAANDAAYVDYFESLVHCVNTSDQTLTVPQTIDRDLLFTVGYGLGSSDSCPPQPICDGFDGDRIMASVSNISFVQPNNTHRSLLELAYLYDHGLNVLNSSLDLTFPDRPLNPFNYTGDSSNLNPAPGSGTKLSVIDFNSSVQLVLQDTSILMFEMHPFHLHGYSFFVVGRGYGNYDPDSSPATFNVINPPFRNTYAVPAGGWVAIRFQADNPGVWLLHCHIEIHISWGMEMAFLVREGSGPNQTLSAPPTDLPICPSNSLVNSTS